MIEPKEAGTWQVYPDGCFFSWSRRYTWCMSVQEKKEIEKVKYN